MDKIIRIENLGFDYGEGWVFHKLNLEITKGDFVAVIGANGAGKSTLLKMLAQVTAPTEGNIYYYGTPIEKFSGWDKIGYVPQNPAKQQRNFPISVREVIALGLLHKDSLLHRLNQADKQRLEELLRSFQLENLQHRKIGELSGGQQQRIAIARAIVNEPKLLLLDEPLGALDLKLRQNMQYELIRLKNELGITFIYVTHDQEEALTMSDTIIVMNQGYIQQMGTPEQIYNEPENAFVADFIGESNIVGGTMIHDELVEIFGAKFACVDKGFGNYKPVDVVIRPEDIDLVKPEDGTLQGVVTHLIFKGVHYEMEVTTPDGYEWLVHSTDMFPVGQKVGIHVDPFDIQIMNKPESEDEEAVGVNE